MSTNKELIWNYLIEDIKNEYGVAGLMGNLQAESGLHPDRVQGDIPYSEYSQNYTKQVDSGEISEYDFVHNGPNGGGYGLAQWTYYTRKQALYDMYKSGGYSSIGSVDLACTYLLYELKNTYRGVYNTLKNATSIREASDKVLHDFENPADQSESVEIKRCELGTAIYDELSGTTGNSQIIQSAIDWAVSIANDDSHGYDQTNRWGPDYDCSSLVIQAYENGGIPVKTNGASYTGDMVAVFKECGFEDVTSQITLSTGEGLKAGDVLWVSGHTEMSIGDGNIVGAHINENGEVTGGATGDQTGNEISVRSYYNYPWTVVLRLPSSGGGGGTTPDNRPTPPIRNKDKKNYKFVLLDKRRRR